MGYGLYPPKGDSLWDIMHIHPDPYIRPQHGGGGRLWRSVVGSEVDEKKESVLLEEGAF